MVLCYPSRVSILSRVLLAFPHLTLYPVHLLGHSKTCIPFHIFLSVPSCPSMEFRLLFPIPFPYFSAVCHCRQYGTTTWVLRNQACNPQNTVLARSTVATHPCIALSPDPFLHRTSQFYSLASTITSPFIDIILPRLFVASVIFYLDFLSLYSPVDHCFWRPLTRPCARGWERLLLLSICCTFYLLEHTITTNSFPVRTYCLCWKRVSMFGSVIIYCVS